MSDSPEHYPKTVRKDLKSTRSLMATSCTSPSATVFTI